jgi:chromosome segregation ATPase
MKMKWLPWACFLGALAGMGVLYSTTQRQASELAQLRQDSQDLQTLRASVEDSKKNQAQSESDELVRLRKENEELLRLRNEVRQLRQDKQQLNQQVQAAQAQALGAQSQAQNAQAQAEALRLQAATNATSAMTAAEQAFRARYGTAAATPEQFKANACLNNLRLLESAKQQWAADNNKPAGSLLTAAQLTQYLPGNTMPSCPGGGVYTLNPVGITAVCNIPGHVLTR